MKRLIASVIVVVAFALYAVFTRGDSTVSTTANLGSTSSGSTSGSLTAQPVQAQDSGEYDDEEDYAGSVVQQQTPTSVVSSAGYADGTYTGSQANALYGTVQVRAVVQGGRIADVQFLSYPTGRRESDRINQNATPILIQEAIAAQSANVQVVSGATLTSRAFMESLQAALNQA
jgi:uncharacterized protein with FMN-binding domain